MSQTKKSHPLRALATIHPGYPFRGKLPLDANGNAFVVQYRHMIEGESIDDITGDSLDRVTLQGRKSPNYLLPSDILFMAKGTRNYAAVVSKVPANTVCTPNFYHIRINADADFLIPEFLAWQINHDIAQRYFSTCSQGSVAPSITKSQLGKLPIVVPHIEQQKLMVNLANTANLEQKLLNQLIENRQRMIDAVGHELLR